MEARCRASIQLLLVQGSGELWAAHGQQLEQRSMVILLDMLARVGGHARAINANGALRRDLAVAQASDQVRPRLSAESVTAPSTTQGQTQSSLMEFTVALLRPADQRETESPLTTCAAWFPCLHRCRRRQSPDTSAASHSIDN